MIVHIVENGVTMSFDDQKAAARQVGEMFKSGRCFHVKIGERESQMKLVTNIMKFITENQ